MNIVKFIEAMNRFSIKTLLFFLSFLFLAFLSAEEEHVEIISNFDISPSYLTSLIQKQGSSLGFRTAMIEDYGKIIPKDKNLWTKLFKKIKLDLPPRPISLDSRVRKIIFWNFPDHYLNIADFRKIPKERLVLFMWEPPSVLGKMHTQEVLRLFGKIYTWNDDLVDNKTYFKFNYTELKSMTPNPIPFQAKKFCTLINSNRSSSHPHELYSERVKAIEFFENHHAEDFDFYGPGWNPEKYRCYRGTVPDKGSIVKNYKFYICYENITNIKGYITEKIFDCFAAACIPVYWGATNVTDYIPKNCFIDRRDFNSLEDLYAFMKGMTETEYEEYLIRIRAFLNSEAAQQFSTQQLEKALYEAIHGVTQKSKFCKANALIF